MRFLLFAKHREHYRAVTDVQRLAGVFDLTKGNLGAKILDATTTDIMWNMLQERDPDLIPWAPLDPTYAQWKATVSPGSPMGFLFGVMRTWAQIEGVRTIVPNQAVMTYGITAQARIEAIKFTEGGIVTGTRQPPRPFYGISADTVAYADAMFDAQLGTFQVTT